MLAATTQQTIAIIVAIAVVVGWTLYLLANVRRSRPEVGSEIELAANRKPYLNDEQLEGPKLDRALRWGLISLAIVGVGLPLYWLAEPGRQSGAVNNFDESAAGRGEELFETTENGGFNCAGCHGGLQGRGGAPPFTLTEFVREPDGTIAVDDEGNPETDLRQVLWTAPAVNTATLKYSDEQLQDILVYGRPFSPMPAWGIEGGGPMNEQQISDLIAYLHSIEISPEEAQEQAETDAETAEDNDLADSYGAALFNTNCARCHTAGWSYGEPEEPGSGAMGPPLTNVLTQFPDPNDHFDWIANGVDIGEQYGVNGQNEGRMPFFSRQLTQEQIIEIVCYERELAGEEECQRPTPEDTG